MDLSIVIVNWNSAAFLRKCLATLPSAAPSLATETIVVDNASYDGADVMIRREFPSVLYVQSDKNLGFAGANNLGARRATGEVLCFLNPDTEMVGPALATMVGALRAMKRPGAVGCKLLNSDGSLQTSCIQSYPTVLNQALDAEWLRARTPRSKLWGMAPLFEGDGAPQPVEVISGACLLMRRDVFESLGGFSEDYFMYGEDLDLCYRAAQGGATNYFVPTASVVHHGGGSSSQRKEREFPNVQMRESVHVFLRKHRGPEAAERYRACMALSARARIALLSLSGSGREASLGKWRGILRWAKGGA